MASETLKRLTELRSERRGFEDDSDRVIANADATIAAAVSCALVDVPIQDLSDSKASLLRLIMHLTQIAMQLEFRHEAKLATRT